MHEELPLVFAMLGRDAIAPLREYLADAASSMWCRITAAHALQEIAAADASARDDAVATLMGQLEQWDRQDSTVNAFLMNYLVDLRATEAAPLMERVFASGCVDLDVQGDWEDVQVSLGLIPERQTLRSGAGLFSRFSGAEPTAGGVPLDQFLLPRWTGFYYPNSPRTNHSVRLTVRCTTLDT